MSKEDTETLEHASFPKYNSKLQV